MELSLIHISGALIGAIAVSWARSTLSENYPDTWQYFYGALFVGAVVLFPGGIVGAYRNVVAWVRAQLPGKPAIPGSPSLEIERKGVTSAD